MKIAVTGATGFIGRRFCELAREGGHAIITIGRTSGERTWEPLNEPAPLESAEAVVHLAGDPVADGRWTKKKMARIRESRVTGTRNLVAGMGKNGPRVLVSGSAIGLYGDRGDEVLTEESGPGNDFLAEVCGEWEAESLKAPCRTVLLRTGIVLGPGGGALGKMLTPFKLCVGGRLGPGTQWMSWVDRDDLCRLILHAIENDSVTGPLLGTAPNPVTNLTFTKTLGRVLGRPTIFPMPRWMIRLIFGKVADVLCGSQRCRPDRTSATGFTFKQPDLEPCLRNILDSEA